MPRELLREGVEGGARAPRRHSRLRAAAVHRSLAVVVQKLCNLGHARHSLYLPLYPAPLYSPQYLVRSYLVGYRRMGTEVQSDRLRRSEHRAEGWQVLVAPVLLAQTCCSQTGAQSGARCAQAHATPHVPLPVPCCPPLPARYPARSTCNQVAFPAARP